MEVVSTNFWGNSDQINPSIFKLPSLVKVQQTITHETRLFDGYGCFCNLVSKVLIYGFHGFRFPNYVWSFLFTLLCTLWNMNNFSFSFAQTLKLYFQSNGKYILQFPQCGNPNCTFHIQENITKYFPHCGNYMHILHNFLLTI